jgi:hypothetical protein
MKSRLLRISAIVAATAAFSVSGSAFSEPRDAQGQAAALLSRPHAPEASQTYERAHARSSSAAVDAHVSAAALLRGQRAGGQSVATPTIARRPVDAHAHAAALLSGSRTAGGEGSRRTG